MAFAQIRSVGTYTGSVVASSEHTVNWPASADSGDLLLILGVCDGTGDNPTVETSAVPGVTALVEGTAQNHGHGVWWVQSDGSQQGNTFQMGVRNGGTPTGEEASAIVFAISGWDTSAAPEISVSSSGASTSPNPAALSPSWGSDDTLWIAFQTNNGNNGTVTFPTNYTDNQTEVEGAGSVPQGASAATRENATATEDPPAFTITSQGWTAWTIAVKPAGGGVAPQSYYYRFNL